MQKGRTAERQLDLSSTQTLCWEELPAARRAQARELLGALLQAVAAHEIGAERGGGDDGE